MSVVHFRLLPLGPGRALPLRHHLVLLVVGVLLPVLAFCVAVVRQLAIHQQRASERRFVQSAQDMAGSVDREMSSTVRALETLAQSERLEEDDLEGFYHEACRVRRTQKSWASIVLFRPDGTTVFTTHTAWGAKLPRVTDAESLQQVVRTRKPAVGSLVERPADHVLAFPVRIPVIFDDDVQYVLSATLEPPAMAEVVAGQRYPGEEWTRTIVDSRGTVVARTRGPEKYVGKASPAGFVERMREINTLMYKDLSMDGHASYVAFSRAPLSNWTAVVVVPTDVVDGPARRYIAGVVAMGGAMLVLSALGAFVFARRVARDIAAAAAAAETLAAGGHPDVPPSAVKEVAQLDQALRSAAELLERRETERGENLARAQAARAEAEAASRAKDEFLAMLGHELRNPLAPIRHGAHLLGTLPPDHPDLPNVRKTIERQVVHMTRLIDDLLDTSRVARGKIILQVRRLDLHELLAQVAIDFTPEFDAAGVSLSSEFPGDPVFVEADPTRLAQCVGNLLHNALKFTPAGGHVRLAMSSSAQGARITITDDGAGIDPQLLPRLFEPFAQGPQNLDRSQGGLGLGLALVKGLIEAHGGAVGAYSEGPGQGATFGITLPVLDFEPAPEPAAEPPAEAPPRRRVLLVEDMPDAARVLRMILAHDGHDVKLAYTAAEAIEIVNTFEPDVVICDIGLPDMDGYALCRRLRDHAACRGATLIALTGYGQAEDVVRAKDAGFDVHLTKPVDVDALKAAIAAAPAPAAVS